MTDDSVDGDSAGSGGSDPNWESIARKEIAASLERQHRELFEEVVALADAVASGADVSTDRIASIRRRYLECDELLADALRRVGELDPDSPAERLEDERRQIARRMQRRSEGVRTSDLDPEAIEALFESEIPFESET